MQNLCQNVVLKCCAQLFTIGGFPPGKDTNALLLKLMEKQVHGNFILFFLKRILSQKNGPIS